MFYTATVKVFFEDDKGRRKAKKETYLVDAESVTEVEAIVNEDFQGSMQEFQVIRVGKSGIVGVLESSKVKKTPKNDEYASIS